jgi:hypothetical protein
MTADQFIEYIKPHLAEENVSFNLAEDLDGFGGWFSEENMELSVWKHNPIFFETLVHEYCHFLQYRDKYDFWTEHNIHTDALFNWLSNDRELSSYMKKKCLRGAITIEWDCEQMSLEYINRNNLPIDYEFYSRTASAYLFSYYTTLETRLWPFNTIYTPDVVEHAPELRELDFYLDKRNLPIKLKRALQTKYIANET